jgi:hypothetical protein
MFCKLSHVTKPTGSGTCHPFIQRALRIDKIINREAGTRSLGDDDIVEIKKEKPVANDNNNNTIVISDDDDKPKIVKAIVEKASASQTQKTKVSRSGRGFEIIDKLSDALDPSTLRARDDERARRGIEQAHFITMSQQLWDSQTTIKLLRSKISNLQARIQASESSRDHAELRLEMMEMSLGRYRRQVRNYTKLSKFN